MAAIPVASPRLRSTTRPKAASLAIVWKDVLDLSLLYACVAIATFVFSSLVGHVLFETTRQRGIEAKHRAERVARQEVVLKRNIALLTAPARVESWAQERGFLTIEQVGELTAAGVAPETPNAIVASFDANAASHPSGENEHGSRAP